MAAGGNNAPVTTVRTPAVEDAQTLQNAFNQVAEAVEPAVVTISTQRRIPESLPRREGTPSPFGPPGERRDPLEEFFRRFRDFGFDFGPGSLDRNAAQPEFRLLQGPFGGGMGSGFIYRSDGYIMTNAHVIQDAEVVTVTLADGREYPSARVIGSDPRTDIAVLKVEANNLPALQLGDSTQTQVGDWAIAMGNPFGLEKSLTVGVISATAREVPLTVSGPGNYLQTDASINPGNSGGPLLNIGGRVIGVNNAIFSQTGGNIGIGFAIPINTAKEIAEILIREGRVRRARMGVAIRDLENPRAFGLPPDTEGVLVEAVEPNSPASRAGLQPGDVILRFNNEKVSDSVEFQQRVGRAEIGSTATVEALRNGNTVTLRPRLEELKEDAPAAPTPTPPAGAAPGVLGVQIAAVTPELARRFNLQVQQGVVIVGLQPNSPAERAGLQPGDLIRRVGQTPVTTPEEVQAAVKQILSRQTGELKSVALYVSRGEESRYLTVPVRDGTVSSPPAP
ncbi:MAG: Do family serine endopeptidase [Armatimonadetes bacterium]|nr:Do family serine endopeptidase [Armatimonadota bacterium]